MPLDLLRRIAFDSDLTGWIRDPPRLLQPPYPVTGLHLRFDGWFLARITEHVFEGGLRMTRDDRPPDLQALLQTRRDERRRACQYAIDNFGTGRDPGFEVLADWEARCREMGYSRGSRPVVVIVDYGRQAEQAWLRELPREQGGYPIRYRPSATAEAHLGPGSRVGSGGPDFGTLGGFLQDGATQDLFAITCAHVAGRPQTSVHEVDGQGSPLNGIGTVVASKLPPTHGPCNRHASRGAGIDAALIELHAAVQPSLPGSLSVGPVSHVDQDDPILFDGSRSGRVTARIAAATIWKTVHIGGQDYCFGDVFSLGHRRPGYVLQAVSRHSDSGAWVLEDSGSASTRWIGMVIGGDKQQNQSLACYGEHVFGWAQSIRPNLVLPP